MDIQEIKKWWQIFVGDGGFTEIRILGRFQYSGYFADVENLIRAIEPYTRMDDEQIYFVLNEIDRGCYGRQQSERIVKSPKITTNDTDIVRRKWVMCDFDPIRKSGTNSSDEELEYAHEKAQHVFVFLREHGFADPVVCMSGNGWHLMYKVDEDVSDETKEIIKGFFKYLASEFTDDKVDFDQKNFNEARICKLYGTAAKKGANLPDRPWRESSIVYAPQEIQTTPLGRFAELAALAPKEESKVAPQRNIQRSRTVPFDLELWLNAHNISYREKSKGGTTMYELEYCPWVDTHSDKKKWDSALFVDANGKITFNCTHSHCHDKTWFDVREYYEPDAYSRQWTPPQPVYVQTMPPKKKKNEIKDEIPELGEKWQALSSIKKVDITQLEKVKTGFTELDKRIGGLYMSELTVLSGCQASGKSSWLNSLLLNIIEQNYKVALWSGELPAEILKAWILMVAAGADNLRQSQYDEGRYYVPDHIAAKIDAWLDGKFYLYNNNYGTEAEQILNDMEILSNAGVKIFALDNMMAMGIGMFEGDKNDRQKNLVLRIKEFAKATQSHVILVAHPRKTTAFLRKNDISGTGDIINIADNCFIYHRTNEDFIHAITEFYNATKASQLREFGNVLCVEKHRLFGVVDYMCGLHYDPRSRRFMNTPFENKHYSWEAPPEQTMMEFEPRDPSMPFEPNHGEECPY